MVSTIKVSQFPAAGLNDASRTVTGVATGANVNNAIQNEWTTATRPISPFNGLMGYNTDLDQWEYWDEGESAWLQFLSSGSGEDWVIVTDASITAVVNMGYITNRTSTPVQITLPDTFNIGDRILVMGLGNVGWTLVCGSGQTIKFGSLSTSVDGSISSDITNSNIEVKGLVANTTWSLFSINSNPTII